MNLDETSLTQLVLKILKQLNIEETPSCERLYVVLPDQWKDHYNSFFQGIGSGYDVNTVVSAKFSREAAFQNLLKTGCCGTVLEKEQIDFSSLQPGISVFPAVSRNLLVKSALCISDTFGTRWVRNCIEQGWKIIFLKQGMEPFSGREPKAYTDCIKRYCRTLTDYGIRISDGIRESTGGNPLPFKAQVKSQSRKEHSRVVTCVDLEQCEAGGRLILNQDDLITPLAAEKAMELGIEIIRK